MNYQDEHGQWWSQLGTVRRRLKTECCASCGQLVYRRRSSEPPFYCLSCRPVAGLKVMNRAGKRAPNWKGGRRVDLRTGYVYVWVGEGKGTKGRTKAYELEHRLVMAAALGRALQPGENVHHKNGIRGDNRIENLELWLTSQPSGHRIADAEGYHPLLFVAGF